MDDLKISYRSNLVLKNTLDQLSKRYGKIEDLTVTYGKVHEFIGATFDFSEDGKLKVKMDDYVEEILESADQLLFDKRRHQAKTPAGTDLPLIFQRMENSRLRCMTMLKRFWRVLTSCFLIRDDTRQRRQSVLTYLILMNRLQAWI